MRLKIVQVGEAVLRTQARPLTRQEVTSDEIARLVDDMRETMYDAPGVGLAAPQVGLPLQLAVIEDREDFLKAIPPAELSEKERTPVPFHVIINPKIEIVGDDTAQFFEGCLSLSGFSALVPRSRQVRVTYWNEHGEEKSVLAAGWYARILQHEIDHLHGTLYIDKMRPRSFTSVENFARSWKTKTISEIVDDLKC
ncbi:MAG TPA: peptide deformylase [Candidatus Eremiobacteraceae bacterium]|nr:peptide deformylase [Candidatus Eremiobacteraceae bacterium]